MSAITIRPYQEDANDAFMRSTTQRDLIVMSTGTGKTVTGLRIAKNFARVLWFAHRKELIDQPAQALQLVDPLRRYGIVKADRNEFSRSIVFASIQTAQQERRLEQLVRERFDLVVVDEAHHALSDGYVDSLTALGCFDPSGPRLLGLTATPERGDGGGLDDVFERIVFQLGITTAIEQGYLVSPTVIEHPINLDLDKISRSGGDFNVAQLDTALMNAGIVDEIVVAFERHASDAKSIIFTVSVDQAEMTAASLRSRGHAVEAVSGAMSQLARESVLRRLKSGELKAVVNCMVLTEGFDEPSVSCLLLARPTQSKSLMIQMVGRGLRLYPGKPDCRVIDLVGVSKRHSLIQAAVLFGALPEDDPRMIEARERVSETDPEEYWRKRYGAQIAGVRAAPRSALNWVLSDGKWLMGGGVYGTVRMVPAGEQWAVDVVGNKLTKVQRLPLSDRAVDLETAQAIAEDYVRRVTPIARLTEIAAENRHLSATDAQVKILKRAGIRKAEALTRGTAADLITQIQERKATEPASPKQVAMLRRMGFKVDHPLTKQEAARMFGASRKQA